MLHHSGLHQLFEPPYSHFVCQFVNRCVYVDNLSFAGTTPLRERTPPCNCKRDHKTVAKRWCFHGVLVMVSLHFHQGNLFFSVLFSTSFDFASPLNRNNLTSFVLALSTSVCVLFFFCATWYITGKLCRCGHATSNSGATWSGKPCSASNSGASWKCRTTERLLCLCCSPPLFPFWRSLLLKIVSSRPCFPGRFAASRFFQCLHQLEG